MSVALQRSSSSSWRRRFTHSWRPTRRSRPCTLHRRRRRTSHHTAPSLARCTVKKYPHIDGYFVASFPRFNVTGSVYDCIRKFGGIITYSAEFTDTIVYGTGYVKTRKTRHEISVDMRIFLQCGSLACIIPISQPLGIHHHPSEPRRCCCCCCYKHAH